MPSTKKRLHARLVRKFRAMLDDQARRQSKRIRDTITLIALAPKIRRTTEDIARNTDAFVALFNDAAEVIDQHFGEGYFTFRLAHQFIPERRICPRGDIARAWALLAYLTTTQQVLQRQRPEPLSAEQRELRKRVGEKLAAIRRKREGLIRRGWMEPAQERGEYVTFRPDPPPEPDYKSYGPRDWEMMHDFIDLFFYPPESAIAEQAKGRDGWWNKRGRKLAASIAARKAIAQQEAIALQKRRDAIADEIAEQFKDAQRGL